ncbi:PAS domain-containing sensor histidine kinase [Sphingobacterium sp. PCS056]|uniref:PAS domain-containing sensor histidine kinase n=1 Tax=Sphingobacterium sp. PCS056 TaxID=2931400 RepID=UPI0020103A1D|nr:PAS domain-containing sensor histidine kinase [Sphingobacterium sp. PCS056]UPZ37804.1 PAS domain-containing sensor histidine kinase [Sphingobacterium sp. PCS056]
MMEQRALHNLKYLEKILDLTSDTLFLIDQDNVCVDAIIKTDNPIINPRIQLIGSNLLDLLPASTAQLMEQEFSKCRQTGDTSNLNYDLPASDQTYFFKFIIHKFDEEHLLCQYRDITQRSNMKYRLKSALQAQLEVGKVAQIGHWSFYTEQQKFFISGFSNIRNTNILEPEIFKLSDLLPYIHPDDRQKIIDFLNMNDAEYGTLEYRMLLPDKPITYVRATKYAKHLENGYCIVDGFSQNVSDFMKNRNELEMVLAVVNNAPYSIFACHLDGRLAFANKACRQQNGLIEEGDISALVVYESLKNFDTRNQWCTFIEKIQRAHGYLQYRCDIAYPEFDMIGSECSSLIIKNGIGEDIVWTIQRDISDQIRYEEQLLKSKEAAEESEKLKSAFISNMNHEIRTPLSAIIGFGNIIADTPDPELRKEYGQILTTNSSQLLRLISDVLEMSQMDAGKMRFNAEVVSLKSILNELSLSFSNLEDHPVLIIDIPEKELTVQLDRGRIMQVLVNLINNSMKFTPPHGAVHIGYLIGDEFFEFYVKDNGIGIPKHLQKSIFNRFFKINEAAKGTGLGLSICKAIVEQMHGEITVESEEGQGTTFRIKLPLHNSDL